MASKNSVIMDGRDIGTNVLKDADVKIFLTASVDERAARRYAELKEKGSKIDYNTVKDDICNRDRIDSTRDINPLKKAEDAIVIDTTSKSIDDVVDEILGIIKKRWKNAI
jgi:cytidylate kinase